MIFYEIKKTPILEQSCKNTATIQYKILDAYFLNKMEDVRYGHIPVYREAEKSAKVFSLFFVF